MSPAVVIVGAGQAGFQVASSLRQAGFEGDVTLVGEEPVLPYQRPPLSKAFLTGEGDPDEVHLRPASFYEGKAITLVTGDRAEHVDRDGRAVTLASGRTLPYDHLVLATGARPRELAVPGADGPEVHLLRTVADAQRLRSALATASRVVVVGGGVIGLEVAASASQHGTEVTVLEALPRTMTRVVSEPMSTHFEALHEAHGVTVLPGETVQGIDGGEVTLGDGSVVHADVVVVGIGVLPNVELAADAGLPIADGVLVDETLRTEDPAVWAVGDCATWPSAQAGRTVRLESVQNATDQGRAVAAAIAGTPEPYAALPWFWTDQHGSKLQIAGLHHGHDAHVVRGNPADGAFSVFLFAGERLVCVESVNRMPDHMAARKALAAGRGIAPDDAADDGFDLKAWAAG